MQTEVEKLLEGFRADDLTTIRPALADVLAQQDEDILIIVIREAVAAERLIAGNRTAIAVSNIILDAEPKRSLLARFAGKLRDRSMSVYYLFWLDHILARNVGMEPEEWEKEWSKLDDVITVRKALAS